MAVQRDGGESSGDWRLLVGRTNHEEEGRYCSLPGQSCQDL